MEGKDSTLLCPNCETEMIAGEGEGILLCPVCSFTLQPCPDCGGSMVKRVVAPEGVEIDAGGLPLGLCDIFWICRDGDCGHRIDTNL
jgi:hypothetical protein